MGYLIDQLINTIDLNRMRGGRLLCDSSQGVNYSLKRSYMNMDNYRLGRESESEICRGKQYRAFKLTQPRHLNHMHSKRHH